MLTPKLSTARMAAVRTRDASRIHGHAERVICRAQALDRCANLTQDTPTWGTSVKKTPGFPDQDLGVVKPMTLPQRWLSLPAVPKTLICGGLPKRYHKSGVPTYSRAAKMESSAVNRSVWGIEVKAKYFVSCRPISIILYRLRRKARNQKL